MRPHIKNVPGRKTDVNDATWIADLLACGLIKASFVPGEDIQELRSLTRTRKQLVREQTRHVQRIEKTLAEANIKLNSVISDIMGASGRRMIEAMIKGVRQPRQLAELAGKQIKATPKELYDALHRVRDRLRHEPLSNRWAPRLLVRAVSRAKRKRRQAQTFAPAQGIPLAQDHAGAMRLGRQAQERQLLPSPVLPAAKQARATESHLRCRGIDPHRRLPHPQKRYRAP